VVLPQPKNNLQDNYTTINVNIQPAATANGPTADVPMVKLVVVRFLPGPNATNEAAMDNCQRCIGFNAPAVKLLIQNGAKDSEAFCYISYASMGPFTTVTNGRSNS
jgi:hypothetical protein